LKRRRAKGLALFYIDKDIKDFFFDLKLMNIRILGPLIPNRYYDSTSIFSEIEYSKPDIARLPSKLYFCMHSSGKKFICKIYFNGDRKIYAVAFISFSTGILRALSRRAEEFGWRRGYLVDLIRPKYTQFRFF